MSEPAERGNAWSDLLKALTLLWRSRPDAISPLNCAHDTLWVNADVEHFTADEIEQLGVWGFFPEEESGGFMSFRFGSA